jgi:hypothetical protein
MAGQKDWLVFYVFSNGSRCAGAQPRTASCAILSSSLARTPAGPGGPRARRLCARTHICVAERHVFLFVLQGRSCPPSQRICVFCP